jgi:group I intron endonuclease
MLLKPNEFHKVQGEIYKITNIVTEKSYIGQTRSHRLNHGKYRPFGHLGRFRDHIAEANSNKKNQCRYLNSSLLKYGFENFKCELILTCYVEDLDSYEVQYISQYKTKFPNGYNLTDGGQARGSLKGEKIILNESELVKPEIKKKITLKKSDYTKKLISDRLKESKSDPEHRNMMMIHAQKQHLSKKFEVFRNVTICESDIDKYIHVIRNNRLEYEYIRVKIDGNRTNFIGKYETTDKLKERAREFIKELIKWRNSLMRETTLEPSLPLQSGNSLEELG